MEKRGFNEIEIKRGNNNYLIQPLFHDSQRMMVRPEWAAFGRQRSEDICKKKGNIYMNGRTHTQKKVYSVRGAFQHPNRDDVILRCADCFVPLD